MTQTMKGHLEKTATGPKHEDQSGSRAISPVGQTRGISVRQVGGSVMKLNQALTHDRSRAEHSLIGGEDDNAVGDVGQALRHGGDVSGEGDLSAPGLRRQRRGRQRQLCRQLEGDPVQNAGSAFLRYKKAARIPERWISAEIIGHVKTFTKHL